ncbi:MAG: phage portal protein [Bacteroidales bacterium]|nr:phage portal protein [Bacteroidales bacterium]
MSNMTGNEKPACNVRVLNFAAIDRYVEDNVVRPVERKLGGAMKFVSWGRQNEYPDYLLSLRRDVSTLSSIIDGCRDYTAGNGARLEGIGEEWAYRVNKYGETANDIVKKIADDFATFGGFAIQVIRNNEGNIAELYHIDMRCIRRDEDKEVYYYSEEFGKRAKGYSGRVVVYPRFMRDGDAPASIYYYSNDFRKVYPSPMYEGALKACEIERLTDDFHLNSILNGFTSSYLVNFNNGNPEDEIKEEIERQFTEKFAGPTNAGRIIFNWNFDKDSATTLEKIEIADYSDRYESLVKHCRQKIFTSFRANPNLFGIPTEGTGFNSEEYEQSFKLFNRTVIRPMQKSIVNAFRDIFGMECLVIDPFSLDDADTDVAN